MDNYVLYLKLITGEHLISEVEGRDEEFIFLLNPMELHLHNSVKGSAVRITKWIPFVNEEDFPLLLRNVLLHATPTEDIVEYYYEARERLLDNEKKDLSNEIFEERIALAMLEKFSNNNIVVH